MELVVTEKPLTAKQTAFLREYHSGEHQGNGTKAYQAVYSVVGEMLSVSTCGSCASALLRDFRCQAYLKMLSEAKAAKLQDKLSSWESLAAEAQQTVLEVMRGTCRSRMRYDASLVILDRALGRVVNRTELEVGLDADEVLSCLHALASRTRLLGDGHN